MRPELMQSLYSFSNLPSKVFPRFKLLLRQGVLAHPVRRLHRCSIGSTRSYRVKPGATRIFLNSFYAAHLGCPSSSVALSSCSTFSFRDTLLLMQSESLATSCHKPAKRQEWLVAVFCSPLYLSPSLSMQERRQKSGQGPMHLRCEISTVSSRKWTNQGGRKPL
ncbi:hypothetical protein C8J57DRAFT_671355 [Mycena rebaudengoi]|nr:hypothetical protein C8J57DRAFT_671355 [Mycena rebaudengoi]